MTMFVFSVTLFAVEREDLLALIGVRCEPPTPTSSAQLGSARSPKSAAILPDAALENDVSGNLLLECLGLATG